MNNKKEFHYQNLIDNQRNNLKRKHIFNESNDMRVFCSLSSKNKKT